MVPSDKTTVRPAGPVDLHVSPLPQGMARAPARAGLGIAGALPFRGEDVWTGYEFSWLDAAGKPQVACLRLRIPCTSPSLVESKSMKLYLNGFAETRFAHRANVVAALAGTLSAAFGAAPVIEVLETGRLADICRMPGESLDALPVEVTDYARNPELLTLDEGGGTGGEGTVHSRVTEAWHTDLFRSLCPITGQPDWASLLVEYTGAPVDPGGLLRYLVSYRRHRAFHEDTVERIFIDISERCRPDELTVYGRFLRRGGLDINPFRSTLADSAPDMRLPRQ